ncbi:hypothetical protein [Streptomyces sp. NBC_00557]|uniref:hypothetical protein n=1 Tax=Streptomyces sp. NBC_00557 TaxID=2975776 RepID=UPI002E819403|nr:hypothetical protein [Streptomyces sp. NBC_00557]WUC35675.1 hypothetical protein OG956_16320 [Streptomyces sp. NBC_00557]
MLPLDPQADPGRRAWGVDCPGCDDRGRWRYLLSNTGSLLHLQCPACHHVWTHESGFGATRSAG